jgi:hypothetical protein
MGLVLKYKDDVRRDLRSIALTINDLGDKVFQVLSEGYEETLDYDPDALVSIHKLLELYQRRIDSLTGVLSEIVFRLESSVERGYSFAQYVSGVIGNKLRLLYEASDLLLQIYKLLENYVSNVKSATSLDVSVYYVFGSGVRPEVKEVIERLRKEVEDYEEQISYLEKSEDPEDRRLARILKMRVNKLKEELKKKEEEVRKSNRYVYIPPETFSKVNELIKELNSRLDVFGEVCGWVSEEVYAGGYVDRALIINMLANCAHSLASALIKTVKELESGGKVRGRLLIVEDTHPLIAKLASEWDRYVEENNKYDLYSTEDYDRLSAILRGNLAEFRVGSTAGHRTRVWIHGDRLFIRYYDTDNDVNEELATILRKLGFECSVIEHRNLDPGVYCYKGNVTEDDVINVAKALSLTTSMDLNLMSKHGIARLRERIKELFGWSYE